MSGDVLLVFIAVVGARFLVPLLIPRYPLPAIIACLVLDGVGPDDLPGLRLRPARLPELRQGDGRLLPGDRLPRDDAQLGDAAGVRVGESCTSTGWSGWWRSSCSQVRALLLIFPNTFEYFFIAYEGVRSRWRRCGSRWRWWLGGRADLGVHQAAPGVLDPHRPARLHRLPRREHLGPASAPRVAGRAGPGVLVRGPPRLMSDRLACKLAADPLPEEMDTAAEQPAWRASAARPLGGNPREGGPGRA